MRGKTIEELNVGDSDYFEKTVNDADNLLICRNYRGF
ncbi:MAG: hypothetical protein XD78_1888 [Desulfotomaculum sp. 46_296]|nr:MAG: hypothetical protein XD78_1888 [Desulfotomaculum sp. 46_296]